MTCSSRGRCGRGQSFRRYLPLQYSDEVEFYDPDRYMVAAPILDNILFGRIGFGDRQRAGESLRHRPRRSRRARPRASHLSARARLRCRQGRQDVAAAPARADRGSRAGWSGAPASSSWRMRSRASPRRTATRCCDRLREAMEGRTFVTTIRQDGDVEGFDRVIRFDGPRIDSRNIVEPDLSA